MSEPQISRPWLKGHIFDGHYQLGQLIARGGMAEVYHAVDLWSNNPVAVKVLLPHLSADPTQQQKFFREGNALSKIRHRHVVGVLASGSEEVAGQQVMFLVLDYVHGSTLAQLLTQRPVLSVGELLEVTLPVVEGLSEVHAHRMIHRDLKPANVLLDSETRTVKLSDFGLTRRADQGTTGQLMGTPSFVAPEILEVGGKVGPQADIFALGVMMFRMVSGRMPFAGAQDDQQVLYLNMNSDIPPVTPLVPGLPADIAGIIAWSTRRRVQDRPQDATELYRALTEIKASLSPEELALRAPLDQVPLLGFWEQVEEIAEASGAAQVYRQTPISAFGQAQDLLEEESPSQELKPWEEEKQEEEEELAEESQELIDPRDFPDPEQEEEEDWEQEESHKEEELSEEQDTPQPISAAYNPQRSRQAADQKEEEGKRQAGKPTFEDLPPAQRPEATRRQAPQPWRQPALPLTWALASLGLLFSLVLAGLAGWWLAQFLL